MEPTGQAEIDRAKADARAAQKAAWKAFQDYANAHGRDKYKLLLEGARFAETVLAPLNQVGDDAGCRFDD